MLSEIIITHLEKNFNIELLEYLSKNIDETYSQGDLLINGVFEMDEINLFNNIEKFEKDLMTELDKLFEINKLAAYKMIKSKRGIIIFLFNSNNFGGVGEFYSPIYSNAKLSLMKTLSKELSAFNITCFGIVLPLCNDIFKHKKIIKSKVTDILSLKTKPLKKEEIYERIKKCISNYYLFEGQLITLSKGVHFIR